MKKLKKLYLANFLRFKSGAGLVNAVNSIDSTKRYS
jgi:hypothetical protein